MKDNIITESNQKVGEIIVLKPIATVYAYIIMCIYYPYFWVNNLLRKNENENTELYKIEINICDLGNENVKLNDWYGFEVLNYLELPNHFNYKMLEIKKPFFNLNIFMMAFLLFFVLYIDRNDLLLFIFYNFLFAYAWFFSIIIVPYYRLLLILQYLDPKQVKNNRRLLLLRIFLGFSIVMLCCLVINLIITYTLTKLTFLLMLVIFFSICYFIPLCLRKKLIIINKNVDKVV